MVTDIHDHKTRGSNMGFHISKDDVVGSFGYFGKKQWNAIPSRLKSLRNIDLFKTSLRTYFLESYS